MVAYFRVRRSEARWAARSPVVHEAPSAMNLASSSAAGAREPPSSARRELSATKMAALVVSGVAACSAGLGLIGWGIHTYANHQMRGVGAMVAPIVWGIAGAAALVGVAVALVGVALIWKWRRHRAAPPVV